MTTIANMELKFKPFDPPTRPARCAVWSVQCWYLSALTLTLGAAMTETWWSLPLVVCVGLVLGWLGIREWRWRLYADRVDRTFLEIGQAADTLSKQLKTLAEQAEQRAAAAREADAKRAEDVVTVSGPGAVSLSVEPSTTHAVRYWVSTSNGQN